MDRDVVLHQMTDRFRERFGKALDALEAAPDGQWIAASERVFRDVFLELAREAFQEALQSKMDAHPAAAQAAFSPSGQCGGGGAAQQRRAERGDADDGG